jgi:hypothetical protein
MSYIRMSAANGKKTYLWWIILPETSALADMPPELVGSNGPGT